MFEDVQTALRGPRVVWPPVAPPQRWPVSAGYEDDWGDEEDWDEEDWDEEEEEEEEDWEDEDFDDEDFDEE